MKTLLRGGYVVSGRGCRRADVLIDGEKVEMLGHIPPELAAQSEVVDVTGCMLFPGFIDAHTHFDLDVCSTTTADDFESGSKSAIRGGTTTVIDLACPNKGESLAYGLDLWHKKADGKCYCDYGFHMTIDDWNETIEREIDDMYAEGISSFKMYMTYPAMMIGDEAMYKALKKLKEKGGICGVHCENAGVIDALIAEKKAAGENGVHCHPETRPDIMEAEAVGRLLRIAEQVDVPVVIVHTTNIEALDEIANARWRGQKVFVETCPQYLVLDDSVYYNEDWLQAAKYVCSPPIRKPADCEALWRAIRRGEVQTVSTDHCSFTTAQKLAGRDNFTAIPGGIPGVETRGELIYTFGVAKKKIGLGAMCRVLAENPAKLYGLFPRKGVLAPGSDADIVVYDPNADHVIRAEDMVGAADYNPYEGGVLGQGAGRAGRQIPAPGQVPAVRRRGHVGQDVGLYPLLPVPGAVSGRAGAAGGVSGRAQAQGPGLLPPAAVHFVCRRRRGAVFPGDLQGVFHHPGLFPDPHCGLDRPGHRGVLRAAGSGAGVLRCR